MKFTEIKETKMNNIAYYVIDPSDVKELTQVREQLTEIYGPPFVDHSGNPHRQNKLHITYKLGAKETPPDVSEAKVYGFGRDEKNKIEAFFVEIVLPDGQRIREVSKISKKPKSPLHITWSHSPNTKPKEANNITEIHPITPVILSLTPKLD